MRVPRILSYLPLLAVDLLAGAVEGAARALDVVLQVCVVLPLALLWALAFGVPGLCLVGLHAAAEPLLHVSMIPLVGVWRDVVEDVLGGEG